MRYWLLFIIPLFLTSCWETKTAIIWTDRPEVALYAGYFNSSQEDFKVEVLRYDSPAQKLAENGARPDILIGSWLKSSSTREYFRPLDYLLKEEGIDGASFYAKMLDLGRIEKRQYLLPLSFNIPAIVFKRSVNELLPNQFVASPEEIQEAGKAYNRESQGSFTQMGFSPVWNREFLLLMARIYQAAFREAAPLAWDAAALERSVQYIRGWIADANLGAAAEEDFTFKYFYIPPAKLAISGRILFTYLSSSNFFTLPDEQQRELDFRWIAGDDSIPLLEDTVYYGICKSGKARGAAEAFTLWLFKEETQSLLLEECKNMRILETRFGLAGGFSAMKTVTEGVFPKFYPSLLGHMPQESYLSPANILPQNWAALKEETLLPYLYERVRSPDGAEQPSLERRIAAWSRINSGR